MEGRLGCGLRNASWVGVHQEVHLHCDCEIRKRGLGIILHCS